MVSLLPPQSDVTLPGPTRLEGEPQGDLMQAPGLPGSPAPQSKHAGFSCSSSFVPDGPPERAPSLPPHSPSIASPGPEQVQGHCPAGPSLGPFRLSPSDKYPSGFGFEEGPAGSPGRFLKGSHVPFHLYKRHFHDDVFPDAQTALPLDGHSFKTPGSLEAFEEIPVDVGDTEAFLPGFSAEAWCNGLPYPSQEHSPQVLEAYCSYVIILMALLWCTEALPVAVTALFPVFLFPMMGIMDASEVCIEYLSDTSILFIGGLLVAIAVEHWNLHKRIALRVLLIIGVRPAVLILGFMVVTAFLSMWISNTATTAMMVPIAHAVLEQLHGNPTSKDVEEGSNNPTFELQEPSGHKEVTKLDNGQFPSTLPAPSGPRVHHNREQLRFTQGMSLCVCYSASIGGIATLTGTTPNLVLQGQVNSLFPQNANVVNFASWFGFAFPTMVILLLLAWLWLQIAFLGFNFRKNFGIGGEAQEQEQAAYRVIQTEHRLLGSMTFAEKAISFFFVTLVLLWFTREPGFFLGWGNLAFPNAEGESMLSDGTVAIFISVIMFIVPSKIPGLTQDPENPGKLKAPPALLNWKMVNEKMHWNVVILLGGGFALAKGSERSGLSVWLGEQLTPLQNVPPPAVAFILCLVVATFTECTSNVATTTLFLPILASMAQAICLHPLYVMLPCTLASSLAFMLPVATPPNAIVFSFGGLEVSDMARTGFLLNIIGVLVIMLAINSWGYPVFNLYAFPSWAHVDNTTAHCQPNFTMPQP